MVTRADVGNPESALPLNRANREQQKLVRDRFLDADGSALVIRANLDHFASVTHRALPV